MIDVAFIIQYFALFTRSKLCLLAYSDIFSLQYHLVRGPLFFWWWSFDLILAIKCLRHWHQKPRIQKLGFDVLCAYCKLSLYAGIFTFNRVLSLPYLLFPNYLESEILDDRCSEVFKIPHWSKIKFPFWSFLRNFLFHCKYSV